VYPFYFTKHSVGLWKYDSGPAGDSDGVTTTSPPMENGTADRVAAVEG